MIKREQKEKKVVAHISSLDIVRTKEKKQLVHKCWSDINLTSVEGEGGEDRMEGN